MPHALATDPSTEPGSNLRNERDRFAIFALTAADVFLETNHDLNIRFATGATQWLLGRDAADVTSKNVLSFIGKDHAAQLILALPLSDDGETVDMLMTAHAYKLIGKSDESWDEIA